MIRARRIGSRRSAMYAVLLMLSLGAASSCGFFEGSNPASDAPADPPVPPAEALALDIQAREFAAGRDRLGVNLPPISSWSNTPMYVDAMRQARRFGSAQAPWDEKAVLGEDGWPLGDFGVMVMSSQSELSTLGGAYTLSFRGQAAVKVVASPATLGPVQYDAATQLTTIVVTVPPHTDQLSFSFTGTRGPIKDLRLIRPGYDAAAPPRFTREFLDHIAPFKVVRLMDWLRTNDNPVGQWALRATPETTHYASDKGVPWEDLIELARVADKDLWINVPALADDEYVHALARLLRRQLPPDTRIYVEYSNEVWNSIFRQSSQNLEAAKREIESGRDSQLDYDHRGNQDLWRFRRIPQRARQISEIFRAEFGDSAMMSRVRPVYALQIVNTYSTELALDYMARTFGPPNRYFFALAGAPYFNMGPVQRNEGLSVDQVLAAMSDSVDAMPQISSLEKNLALASWYQLPLLAYEGGPDTFGPGSLEAKKAASLDPRMQTLCRRHLDNWYAGGGGLFMWFTAGAGSWNKPYGTWELTTDLAITDTPKLRCMHEVLAGAPPPLRGRNTVPGRIDARAFAGNTLPYTRESEDLVRHLPHGRHLDYLVLAPATGTYELILNADAGLEGNRVAVATAYGAHAGRLEIAAQGWDRPTDTAPLPIPLRKGFNTLRLTVAGKTSGFGLRHLTVRRASSGRTD